LRSIPAYTEPVDTAVKLLLTSSAPVKGAAKPIAKPALKAPAKSAPAKSVLKVMAKSGSKVVAKKK
jgi:hypothetical protein